MHLYATSPDAKTKMNKMPEMTIKRIGGNTDPFLFDC